MTATSLPQPLRLAFAPWHSADSSSILLVRPAKFSMYLFWVQ